MEKEELAIKVVAVCILALSLMGCTPPSAPSASETSGTLEGIRYVKDEKTGLCFAVLASNNGHFGNVVSIANVPCSAIKP